MSETTAVVAPVVESTETKPPEAAVQSEAPTPAQPIKEAVIDVAALRRSAMELLEKAQAEKSAPQAEAAPAEAPTPGQDKKPEAPAESSKEVKISSRLAELAEMNQKLRAEREALKRERETLRQPEVDPEKNPLEYIKLKTGKSFHELADMVLKQGEPVDPKEEAKALAAKAMEEVNRIRAEAMAEKERAHVESYRAQIASEAVKAAEQYELVNIHGEEAVEMALSAISTHYQQHGEFPGGSPQAAIGVALNAVEQYLEERGSKFLQSKRLRVKLNATAAPATNAPAPNRATSQKTLENSLFQSPPATEQNQSLTVEERRAKAVAILQAAVKSRG